MSRSAAFSLLKFASLCFNLQCSITALLAVLTCESWSCSIKWRQIKPQQHCSQWQLRTLEPPQFSAPPSQSFVKTFWLQVYRREATILEAQRLLMVSRGPQECECVPLHCTIVSSQWPFSVWCAKLSVLKLLGTVCEASCVVNVIIVLSRVC